jgi:hypothetical protein
LIAKLILADAWAVLFKLPSSVIHGGHFFTPVPFVLLTDLDFFFFDHPRAHFAEILSINAVGVTSINESVANAFVHLEIIIVASIPFPIFALYRVSVKDHVFIITDLVKCDTPVIRRSEANVSHAEEFLFLAVVPFRLVAHLWHIPDGKIRGRLTQVV